MICPWGRAGAVCEVAGALLLGGNSRAGCWMGLGLLVVGAGAGAMGGKLGLGVTAVLMGGGGRGGKPGVGDAVGDVVGAGIGLGDAPAASWGCRELAIDWGLAGAEAVCEAVGGRSSILIIPVVRPALATSRAATLSPAAEGDRPRWRLRLGRAMASAAQSSNAVAKSNSCRVLRCTAGPDSAGVKVPKNKLWASKPRGSRRGPTGR